MTGIRKTMIALAAVGALGIGALGASTEAQANDHYGGHYGGYSQPSGQYGGGYSQYGRSGGGYSQYGRIGGYSTGSYQSPHYHAPSMHYDRVYHADRLHWTPRRGLHTHGHYDVVPHYTPGHWHW